MYAGDSLFTLSRSGQIGLIALSIVLASLLIYAVHRGTARMPLPLRIGFALAAFWLFLWLSPQIYYTYYRQIFDGLPAQTVTGMPPGIGHIARILLFCESTTLAAHAQAVLGWGLIAVALKCRNAAN